MALSFIGRSASNVMLILRNEVSLICSRGAKKKAGASTRNKLSQTRDKHRGWKKYDGDYVEAGMILYRQLGLKVYPGENVGIGRDHSLFAMRKGKVVITKERLSPYPDSPLFQSVKAGRVFEKHFFNVVPDEQQKQVFKLTSLI